MKIGIVGCGLNSDYHINFARSYPGADICGVADNNRDKAYSCAGKHRIPGIYSSVKELIEKASPHIIHVVVPPYAHYQVTNEILQGKIHALVEKPLALNIEEATDLYDRAEKNGVKLCAMHNHLFDPCMQKARDLIKKKRLGNLVHIESYYGLNTQIPTFREYPAPNVLPWIYELPGGVYQDFLPHALYVMLEFTGRLLETKVVSRCNGVLPKRLPDEIRILLSGAKATGVVSISFCARPHLHFVRFYGTKMVVETDINTMTTIIHPLSALPKAAQKATYNLSESWQLIKSTAANVMGFLTGRLKPYQGMRTLIHQFYDSILHDAPMPVTREQALDVVFVTEEISKQLAIPSFSFVPLIKSEMPATRQSRRILVTGGTGFLGRSLVARLVNEGYHVRVLARKLSNIEPIEETVSEIFFGDVADQKSLSEAFEGIDIVVHAAAGTSGGQRDSETATIGGSRNVLDLCEKNKIGKLIYISSCSVYSMRDGKKNGVISEDSPLEKYPALRGYYSASKLEADNMVKASMRRGYPITVLRPGIIYGPGIDLYSPTVGFAQDERRFIVIGNGSFQMPLVYIENLIDAIILAIEKNEANDKIYNVVDTEKITKTDYMDGLIRKMHPDASVWHFPFFLLIGITICQELLCKILRRRPFLTCYRLSSSQKSMQYSSAKIAAELGWSARVSFQEAASRILDFSQTIH